MDTANDTFLECVNSPFFIVIMETTPLELDLCLNTLRIPVEIDDSNGAKLHDLQV